MGDISTWLAAVGVLGALVLIGTIVFAESGLLVGLLLPGDTLLFTAGFFAAQGQLPLAGVMITIFIGSVMGDSLGYFVGSRAGPRIFRKKDGLFFKRVYLRRAQRFYKNHGGKMVTLARFVPYVRTFAPMVAGAARMHYPKFFVYNVIGALVWTISFVSVGYWLGVRVSEQIQQYAIPAFIIGLLFAFSPSIIYIVKNKKLRVYLANKLRLG
jgi:membrane-associated protein